jgi:hypothetical protein
MSILDTLFGPSPGHAADVRWLTVDGDIAVLVLESGDGARVAFMSSPGLMPPNDWLGASQEQQTWPAAWGTEAQDFVCVLPDSGLTLLVSRWERGALDASSLPVALKALRNAHRAWTPWLLQPLASTDHP